MDCNTYRSEITNEGHTLDGLKWHKERIERAWNSWSHIGGRRQAGRGSLRAEESSRKVGDRKRQIATPTGQRSPMRGTPSMDSAAWMHSIPSAAESGPGGRKNISNERV